MSKHSLRRLGQILLPVTAILFASSGAAQADGHEHAENPASIYAAEFDVTLDEARRRLEVQERVTHLVEPLRDQLEGRFAGIWFDNASGRAKIAALSSSDEPVILEMLQARNLHDVTDTARVDHSYAELVAAQTRLSRRLRAQNPGARMRIAVSARLNAAVITLSSDSSVDERREVEHAAAEEGRSLAVVREAPTGAFDVRPAACFYNQNQQPGAANCTRPLRAGVGIDHDGGGCTSGFIVRQSSAYLVLTSGHCFRVNPFHNWSATHTTSGPRVIGARQDSYLGVNGDYGIVRVNTTSFWMSSPGPAGWFAQWGTNHEQRVLGTGWAYEGLFVCRSGRISTTRCGSVPRDGVDVQTEYSGAEWQPWNPVGRLVMVTGGNACVSEGDSGGPVFNGNTALGIAAASINGQCDAGGNGFYYSQVGHATQAFGVSVQLG